MRHSHSHDHDHGHGHSHGFLGHHHHHEPNAYLTSTNKNDEGVRVTRLGLYVNVAMAVGKGIGGYVFNSQALIADAFHALTDLVSDFMTLATLSVALKPPSDKYPNGFGKVESFGSLVVSGLLLTGGILMCQHSGDILFHQFFADAAHHAHDAAHHAHDAAHHSHDHSHGFFGHSHSAQDMIPNINAAWIAGGSIIVKEYLYRITMKVAKERRSSVLASNAVHHRIDSLTSIVALVAIGGSHVIPGATWLDPVGGLLVSLMVIQAGYANTKQAVYELCDATVESDVKESVRRSATKALPSNEVEIREIQGIKAGQNYLMDVELAAPATWTLEQMQGVENAVRERVCTKVRGIKRIRIRYSPKEETRTFLDEFTDANISVRSSPEPESEHEHDHGHDHDHDHAKATGASKKGSASKRN